MNYIIIIIPEDTAINSPPDESLHQGHPPVQTDWKSNKSKLTDELRNQIVKECCEDLISPAELASRHGVNVVQIRKIVKDAGKKLPTKYKVTSSKNLRFVLFHHITNFLQLFF